MKLLLRALRRRFRRLPTAPLAIEAAERTLGTELPGDYKRFLLDTDGGSGWIGEQYLILWPAQDLLRFQEAYEIQTYVPGLLLFGSDGGGDGFAFDMRTPPWPVVSLPFIGMTHDLVEPVAGSFRDFLERHGGDVSGVGPTFARGADGDMEIHRIQPIILGGHPTDVSNMVKVTRDQHIELVRWWNRKIVSFREAQGGA